MTKRKKSMATKKAPSRAKSVRVQKKSKQSVVQKAGNNKLLTGLLFVVLFGVVGGVLLYISQAASTTKTLTFTPTHDTFATEVLPTEGRNTITELRVINDDAPCSSTGDNCKEKSRVAYLKFWISGVPTSYTTIDSVKMRVYTTDGSADGGKVYRANSTKWDEVSLTWENQPGYDPAKVLGSLGTVNKGTWRDITLTKSAVNGGERGAVAFAIANNDSDMAAYASRETANKPQLIITYTESPPVTTHKPAYPGQPRPGKVYWGSSYQGGADPTSKHETPTGTALGVRREFFQANQVDTAVSKAQTDLTKGRIPVMSFKLPASWGDVAAGRQDAWLDATLKKFDALNGPVWLVFHHEPEGGEISGQPDQYGDQKTAAANHLAMNKHVRERMTALQTDNIALSLTLMGCTYANTCSGRNPADWYAAGVYDIIAADTYWGHGSALPTSPLLSTTTGQAVRKFAFERGKDNALFEWGLGSDMNAQAANLMQGMFDGMIATPPAGQSRQVAAAYFDTTLNGGTPLSGVVLDKFHAIMKDANSTNWPNEVAGTPLQ
jgi:hypothetical protein